MNIGLFKHKKLIFILIVILILAGVGGYYYFQYQKTQSLLKDPNQIALAETRALVDKVGKLIELPVNEEPRIATVSDKTKLIGQSFFAKAENGDKVLIYTINKKAILYRPSTNKIIEVTNVNIQSETPQITPSENIISTPSVSPTVKLSPTSIVTPTP